MKAIRTAIPDVLILDPKVAGDRRGLFERYNRRVLEPHGNPGEFVLDKLCAP